MNSPFLESQRWTQHTGLKTFQKLPEIHNIQTPALNKALITDSLLYTDTDQLQRFDIEVNILII